MTEDQRLTLRDRVQALCSTYARMGADVILIHVVAVEAIIDWEVDWVARETAHGAYDRLVPASDSDDYADLSAMVPGIDRLPLCDECGRPAPPIAGYTPAGKPLCERCTAHTIA